MLDLAMIGTLAVCFLLIKLLADWCGHQIDRKD